MFTGLIGSFATQLFHAPDQSTPGVEVTPPPFLVILCFMLPLTLAHDARSTGPENRDLLNWSTTQPVQAVENSDAAASQPRRLGRALLDVGSY